MFSHVFRLVVAYFALLAITLFVAPAAQAATVEQLVWQDASSQLPMRTNRPVWSMANVGGFLYFTDGQDLGKTGHVWRKDGANAAVDITKQIRDAGLTRVDRIVNNVNDVVFIQYTPGASAAVKYVEMSGDKINTGVSDDKEGGFNREPEILKSNILPKEVLDKSVAAYNGKIWLIVYGKRIFLSDGNALKDLGRTRDYFTTITTDANGAFWLGGAVSTLDSAIPTLPLTAKLVRVTLGDSATTIPSDKLETISGRANGINYWSWVEPNDKLQSNIINPKFTVGAQTLAGLKRIELYVNGMSVGVCDLAGSKTNESCATSIDGTVYAYGTNVLASATIIDSAGRKAEVPAQALRFYDATVQAHGKLELKDAGQEGWDSATYTASATAEKGLTKIDIYLNGKVAKTCDYNGSTGEQVCALTANSHDYAAGSLLSVNAHAIGANGLDAWTKLEVLPLVKTDLTLQPTQDNGISAWLWTEYDLDLAANRTKTVRTQASTKNGLSKIDVSVNGTVRKTCSYNGPTGVQDCNFIITSLDYKTDNSVLLGVRAMDLIGNTAQSEMQITQAAPNSNGTTLTAWLTVTPSQTDMQRIESRTVTAGGDATNGVKKVEILVNNSIVQTCEYYDRTASRACTITIKGDGPLAALGSMAVNARVTDLNGNSTWSQTKVLNVTDMVLAPASDMNVTLMAEPAGQSLLPDQSKQITATAHAKNGIKQIDIYVNDKLVQTCGANGVINQDKTCGVPLSGRMYNPGAWMTVRAQATDINGLVAWSEPQTFTIRDYGVDPQLDINVSISTEPNVNLAGKYADIVSLSQAPYGIQRVLMQADGQPIQACWFGRSEGITECRATLDVSKKNVGDKIVITAQATDAYGNVKETKQTYVVRTPTATELVKNYLEAFVTG